MASVNVKTHIEATVTFDEVQLRALDGMLGYGKEAFLKCFYTQCGTYYLKPYEAGVDSLFDKLKQEVSDALHKIDKIKKIK